MKINKFQMGGEVPAEAAPEAAAAPAPAEQGGDPMEQLIQAAAEAVQTNNAELALQVCAMLLELVQGAQGGAPEGEPMFRRGGRLCKKGGKCSKKC